MVESLEYPPLLTINTQTVLLNSTGAPLQPQLLQQRESVWEAVLGR